MPRCPDQTYAPQQAIARYGARGAPKSSMPMIVQASGVFAAPAKTATNPSAAMKSCGNPSNVPSVQPSAAPMKKIGVTSPPLKLEPSVTAVKTSFQKNAQVGTPSGV